MFKIVAGMTERKFLKINVSTDTTPNSGSLLLATGEKIAKVDLQLPSNMVGNLNAGKIPTEINMKIGKISVSTDNIPVAYIKPVSFPPTNTIVSNWKIGLVPLFLNGNGSLAPASIVNGPNFVEGESYSDRVAKIDRWWKTFPFINALPNGNTQFVENVQFYTDECESENIQDYYEQKMRLFNGSLPISNFANILNGVSTALNTVARRVCLPGAPIFECEEQNGTFLIREIRTAVNNETNPSDDFMTFAHRTPTSYSSRSRLHDTLTPSGDHYNFTGQHMRTCFGSEVTPGYSYEATSDSIVPDGGIDQQDRVLSIVANHAVVDFFHSLPWVKIDTRKYKLDRRDMGGYGREPNYNMICAWDELNDGDPYMYLLNTNNAIFRTATVDRPMQGYIKQQYMNSELTTPIPWVKDPEKLFATEVSFPQVNVVSFFQSRSLAVFAQGLDTFNQILPANISTASGVTTTVPIIEIYHPLWNALKDKSDRLLIANDDFTNTATVSIKPVSILNRNINFQLYIIGDEGRLFPFIIGHHQHFSLQLIFELLY